MRSWIPFIGYLMIIMLFTGYYWSRFHKVGQRITIMLMAIYLVIICRLCLTPIVFNFMTANRNLHYFHGVPYNLLPFQQLDMEWFLNIMMTIPFGILLYLMWPKLSVGSAIIFGMLFSGFIEGNQFIGDFLFNIGRVADVDDIVTNTLGTVVSFVIMYLLSQTFIRKIIKPFTLH